MSRTDYAYYQREGELPPVRTQCDECGDWSDLADLFLVPGKQPLFLCAHCKEAREEQEPPCACTFTGDMADARGCDLPYRRVA
jgi:hypothetical protein